MIFRCFERTKYDFGFANDQGDLLNFRVKDERKNNVTLRGKITLKRKINTFHFFWTHETQNCTSITFKYSEISEFFVCKFEIAEGLFA